MTPPKHILVFRFSSLGDIAMTVPVLKLLLYQHPSLQVTFVSVAFVKPLFEDIERLHFVAADLKEKHKGVGGLYRLYKELTNTVSFDAIADLHNVLRTQILRIFFSGKRIATINKGRKEKRELTRRKHKVVKPLPSTFQRYADVFASLDLPTVLDVKGGIKPPPSAAARWQQWKIKGVHIIGIAPFARYAEKTYPKEKMMSVIALLLSDKNIRIALFGGKEDAAALSGMASIDTAKIGVIAGSLSFSEELSFIAQLDAMISMDSANMHLASLYGVPVVSIWGGTHPFLGFLGWGQTLERCVQIDLDCRPSSVFGNKPCPNQLACMNGILPLMIVEKVMALLSE